MPLIGSLQRAFRSGVQAWLKPVAVLIFAGGAVAQGAATFDDSAFRQIDLQRAARDQHGPRARVVLARDHLYGWQADVGGQALPLNLKQAVATQFGPRHALVAVGLGARDWRALDLVATGRAVLPAMVVSADLIEAGPMVASGQKRFESVLVGLSNWYALRVGKRYRMLQPIILRSDKPARELERLSQISTDAAHRFDLLMETKANFERELGRRPRDIRVAMSVLTGHSPDQWLGAGSVDGFAMAPPRATSIDCPPSGATGRCANAEYALGHELGHAFGLGHSCTDFAGVPGCGSSVMETAEPDAAILLPQERKRLLAGGFFQ